MALELELSRVEVQQQTINNLSWLTPAEKEVILQTLGFMDLKLDINSILESNSIKMTYFFRDDTKGVVSVLQNVKLNENTRLEIISFPNNFQEFEVKFYHLKENDDEKKLRFVSYLDGKLISDKEEDFQDSLLENPNLLDLYNDTISNNQEEDVEVAWGGLPCLQNGCCIINEPLYPGSAPLVPVYYNWCGANCGSGSPVNSVDTCCRTHDYCYGSFKGYPSRYACDKNIRNCVASTGYRAAGIISAGFAAKMLYYGC